MRIEALSLLVAGWAAALVGVGWPVRAAAANEAQGPTTVVEAAGWELELLLRQALARSERLREARAALAAARAGLQAARLAWIPEVRLEGVYRIAGQDERTPVGRIAGEGAETGDEWVLGLPEQAALASLSVRAPLWRWGSGTRAVAAAAADVRMGEAEIRALERAVVLSAQETYVAGVAASERAAALKERAGRLEELFQLASNLYEGGTGLVGEPELARLELVQAEIRMELGDAELDREDAQRRVDGLLGSGPERIDLATRRLPRPQGDEPGAEETSARRARGGGEAPEIVILEAQRESVDQRRRALRAGRLPSLALAADGAYWRALASDRWEPVAGGSLDDYPGPAPNPAWNVRLALSFPLSAAFRDPPAAAALASEQERLEASLAALHQQQELERAHLVGQHRGVTAGLRRLEELQKSARKRYDQAVQDFAVGLAALTQVIETERLWREVEARFLRMLTHYHRLAFQLEQSQE